MTLILCAALLFAPTASGADAKQPAANSSSAEELQPCVLTGFTVPFQTTTLASVYTGRIMAMPVDEGDVVAAGQVALRMDDAVQRRRVDIAKASADSTIEVELARADWEDARWELDRLEKLDSGSYAAEMELREARTAATAAKLTLDHAIFKHDQAVREHKLQQAVLEELSVKAPFDGYIAERLKEVGDTVEEREDVLKLVQLDPLIVALDCPLEYVSRIRAGAFAELTPLQIDGPARRGEIYFINRVADPASQTFKVKIRVPNPDSEWIAGMSVAVNFDDRDANVAGKVDQLSKHDSQKDAERPRALAADER